MKELSIEGKAKAYDELIKRLNKAREDVGGYTFKSVYDEVMSELAESEDEKFLRYLIDCCKDTIESDDKGLELSMVTTKRLFAWLEKQGEKGINGKNREIPFADKVEPKFKVGDYIKHNKANIICKVVSVNSGSYYVENIETGGRIELFNAEQNFHLWAIQDAKDGDVLATDNGGICIFDGTVEEGKYPFAYCGVTERGFEIYDRKLPFTHTNIQPATKEQRDTLMKAMADAGYTFDFEKKELKKIEQKPAAWSEEDDDNLSWLVEMLLGFDGNDIECYKDKKFIDKCKEVCKWLKAIKDRTFPQPKQEWSEEDEKYLIYNIEQDYRDKLNNNPPESLRPYYNKVISLLKSILHQKQWKPSDEQMMYLSEAVDVVTKAEKFSIATALEALREQLKKLREG